MQLGHHVLQTEAKGRESLAVLVSLAPLRPVQAGQVSCLSSSGCRILQQEIWRDVTCKGHQILSSFLLHCSDETTLESVLELVG